MLTASVRQTLRSIFSRSVIPSVYIVLSELMSES